MVSPKSLLDSFTGRTEHTSSSRIWTTITLSITSAQAALIIVLEAYIMSRLNLFFNLGFSGDSTINSGTLPFILVYAALFVVAQVFMVLLVIDAAWAKNTLQIISIAVFNTLCLAFSVVQVFQIESLKLCIKSIVSPTQITSGFIHPTKGCPNFLSSSPVINQLKQQRYIVQDLFPFEIVNCCLSFVFCVASWGIALRTYKNWGWQIYNRSTGADLVKRAILRRYHLFVMFMKYNIYFCAGMILQFVIAYFYQSLPDNWDDLTEPVNKNALNDGNVLVALIVLCAVALIYFIVGWMAVRRGNKILMVLFQVFILAIAGAVVYMFSLTFVNDEYTSTFEVSRGFLILFATASLLINIALFIIGILCFKGFSHPGYVALVTPPPIHLHRNPQQQMNEDSIKTQVSKRPQSSVLELE